MITGRQMQERFRYAVAVTKTASELADINREVKQTGVFAREVIPAYRVKTKAWRSKMARLSQYFYILPQHPIASSDEKLKQHKQGLLPCTHLSS